MDNLLKLKDTILRDYPRMTTKSEFYFDCGPQFECFNHCCADVNIFLTPYDVLRISRRLNLAPSVFLSGYTIIPFDRNQNLPVPLLLMNDTEGKPCPFVDAATGCTIYSDRPWPCRMYPIGVASPAGSGADGEPFYFLMREDVCRGIGRPKIWTVEHWIEDQEAQVYQEFGDLFKRVTLHPRLTNGFKPSEKQIDIYWLGLYELDRFRRFVFESNFLRRFELEDAEIERFGTDDAELLRLGFRWVMNALFGEPQLKVKEAVRREFLINKALGR